MFEHLRGGLQTYYRPTTEHIFIDMWGRKRKWMAVLPVHDHRRILLQGASLRRALPPKTICRGAILGRDLWTCQKSSTQNSNVNTFRESKPLNDFLMSCAVALGSKPSTSYIVLLSHTAESTNIESNATVRISTCRKRAWTRAYPNMQAIERDILSTFAVHSEDRNVGFFFRKMKIAVLRSLFSFEWWD